MAGEEERQPEEQGVVGELEEAEGDGVRSHGGDGESLDGIAVAAGGKQRSGMVRYPCSPQARKSTFSVVCMIDSS